MAVLVEGVFYMYIKRRLGVNIGSGLRWQVSLEYFPTHIAKEQHNINFKDV